MKRLLQFWLWLVVTIASQGATLNYNLGDFTLNPTNVLFSNLVSTAQITWSMGQSGRITGTITFPTTFDENWTNASSVLRPLTAAIVSVSNLNANAARITNGLNVGGKITVAEITVTNAAEFFGLTTNHQTWRGTNTFNGGWSEVTGHQTNRADIYVAGAISGDSGRITNGLTVAGAAGVSILRVTNETTHFGPVTNHVAMRSTNIYDGGWFEVVGPQTNRSDIYAAGGVFADSARITNALNVSGTAAISTLRVTNNATVGGSVSADNAAITNAFSAGSANIGGALNASSVRVTNNVTVGGAVSSDSLNVTNALNASGNVGVSILRVTNETTHVGVMTNHATSRMTNIFDGGWLEIVGPQTNRGKVDIAGAVTTSILQNTNEATMFGLQTNHTTLRVTNIFNGGWNRIQSPSTNETTHWGTNQFNGGWSQVTGNQTNAGFVRATNGLVVPSAGGLTLGTGTTITNILFGSAALTFTAVGAQRYVDASITVTGTTTNDACFLGVPFHVQQGVGGTNLIFSPFTSNDTVWVRCNNYGTATRSTNGVFQVLVFKR